MTADSATPGAAAASRSGEPGASTYRLRGLAAPAEILVDRWGIPHLYAESVDDLYFVQGFNAARDRLFQIDLWRRRGLGLMAEVFGPSYVEQDRAARLFLYRGDMAAEWAAYGFDAEAVATRFTAGINAYLDWLEEHPEALPPEFEHVGHWPARWDPADVVRIRSHGPQANVVNEVLRARMTAAGGPTADLLRQPVKPEHELQIPEGLELDLPEDVLRVFELGTVGIPSGQGSNNWALAPWRTTTGRPLLASDPHRAYTTPSLRYIAHLSAPGLDVIGAGEPSLPGITLGHNGTAAFGFTIFPIDAQDLYVYELHPDDPSRYRYGEDWEAFRTITETVPVKGEADRQVELAFTRHGPVIHVDVEARKAYALRTTWSEPGTSPYFGSIGYLGASSWSEFRSALRHWASPGENHVYADVSGTIAWRPAGLVPRRTGYDGLLPVPGDGRYEWNGFVAFDEFPEVVDPPEGFVATANQYNLPDGFPRGGRFSYEWSDPARFQRIAERLSEQRTFSLEDMTALQTDLVSPTARDVVQCLRRSRLGGLTGADGAVGTSSDVAADREAATGGGGGSDGRVERPDVQDVLRKAVRMLTTWDAVESEDSAPAALYHVWVTRHLGPALARRLLTPDAAAILPALATEVLRDIVQRPREWLGPDADTVLAELFAATLREAYGEAERVLGPDPSTWRWGALHQNWQPHPLGRLDSSWSIGPVPVGGSATTVNAAHYLADDFGQTSGASFRMVIDVGAWDNSVCVNTPGQSGDPRSPHYRDLVDVWRRHEYVPMLYSRPAVEAYTEQWIRLRPADDSAP